MWFVFSAGTRCADRQTCSSALQSPLCGWCDDGSNTGLGHSLEGGSAGAVTFNDNTKSYEVDESRCPKSQWYFTECPSKSITKL